MIVVKILPMRASEPRDKLADAELHFRLGPLEGMKLVGFSVWEHANGVDLTVSFPTCQYAANGERRSFTLLRPIDNPAPRAVVRTLILDAFAAYESTVL